MTPRKFSEARLAYLEGRCHHCGKELTTVTARGRLPEPKDVLICAKCAMIALYMAALLRWHHLGGEVQYQEEN